MGLLQDDWSENTVLRRHGHSNGRVRVEKDRSGVAVHIDIPQGPARVKRVVLRLG